MRVTRVAALRVCTPRGALAVCAAAVVLTACTGGAGDFAGLDGGPGDRGCDPLADAGPDAGCVPTEGLDDPCGALVARCCGETCGESAACAAATLLRDHEPENCAAALDDTQTYPECELGSCDALVEKACGPNDECADAPGCAPAQELLERKSDPDASQDEVEEASAACLQALEDDVVFASCT